MSLDDDLEVFPKLRFREFKTSWKECKLAQILKVGSGKDYKHLNEGDIPVYGSGGYMLSVDDFLHEGKSVCIGRKGTIDNPVLLDGKFWTVDTLFYTHDYDGVVPEYLFALFQNIKWKKYNEASGVPSLSKSTIESIKTWVTLDDNEQQKIADFLSSVDKKISLLKEKHTLLTQYKKGVMQKLFKQEIRFKDDNGNDFPDWQEFPLSEVATPIKRKATEAVENVMTISAGKGFLSQEERFSQVIAGTSLDKYTHLKQGEFSYNRGNSKSYTYGCIYKLDKEQALVPYVYRSFSLSKGDADFFSHLFQFKYLDRQLRRLISSSARMDGLLNIGEKDFYQVRVPFPCEDEQKKIAEFLDALDTKLNAVNQQIELTQTFKKGLLQQMFV